MPAWQGDWFGDWEGAWLGESLPTPDKNTDTPLERTRFVPAAVRDGTVLVALRDATVKMPIRDRDAHEFALE